MDTYKKAYFLHHHQKFDASDTNPISFQIETTSATSPLAGATVSIPLDFGDGGTDYGGNAWFALVGNPFMTSINFDALYGYDDNDSKIKKNYQVWTGNGFVGYTASGGYGSIPSGGLPAVTAYIAPLQAFFVEREGSAGNLSFNLATIQATGANTELRSATSLGNKLDIVASSETASVLTFIAKRGGEQLARKLMDGLSDIPDIYTLAPDATTALGANIISEDKITVPIGLATTYGGNMNLTFSGMEDYDAEIKLYDTQEDKVIDLTEKSSYQYDFAYTPPMNDEDQIIADESRFYIAFAPKIALGMNDAAEQKTSVFVKNNAIHVVGLSDNPIRQIFVYDIQGRILYSETNLNTPVFFINELQPGTDVYIVKVITEKNVENVKVIP